MTTNHINNNMFKKNIAYQELGCILDHLFIGSKSKLEPDSKSNLEPDSTRFPPCQGQVVIIPLTAIHKYGQEEIQHIKCLPVESEDSIFNLEDYTK